MAITLVTTQTIIARNAGALYGVAIGSTLMNQLVAQASVSTSSTDALLNQVYVQSVGTTPTTTVAATLIANLNITGATAIKQATDYIVAVLNANSPSFRGAAVNDLLDLFVGLTNDANFGAAATAYNTKVANAEAYALVAGNVANVRFPDVSSGTDVGTTFTLTTGIDTIVGTAGNDTIQTLQANFGALDTIDGGAGTDTLVVSTTGNLTLTAAQVRNVENLSFNATGATTVSLAGLTGVTSITNNASSAALIVGETTNAVAAVGAVNVLNTAQATTIVYSDAAVLGATDAVTLTVSGVTVNAAVNINSTTANASGVETINLVSTGTANAITLTSNDTATTRVNISGSTAVTLALGGNVTTTATTIDASAATGAVTISGFGTAAHTVTGGTGADRFQFVGELGATDLINGGAGVDTLSANAATLAAFATANRVTNIETLEIANDATNTATVINAAIFGAINNVRIADQGDTDAAAITFNGLTAAATGSNNIRFDGDLGATTGLYTFNITDATNGGVANAVTLDMRGGVTTATSTIALAGVESVTIDTTNATGVQTFNLTDTALTSLIVTGGQSVNVSGAALGTVVGTVNASALTGTAFLNVALSQASVTGAVIVGSNGADVIVGTQLADTITGGNGTNTITGGAGVDTINLVQTTAAIDTIKISIAGLLGVDRDIITGFRSGATTGDVFNFNSGVATLTGTDNFGSAASLQTVSATGNLTGNAAAEVIAFTGATIADATSANSLTGTNLLAAVGGTITGAVVGQNNFLISVGVATGGTAVYYVNSADNAIIASEITLVGVMSDVAVGSLVVGNFANAA
ncbi:hypothetical protein ABXJ76_01150 [Methylobacter sp. G7]|uniref:beta strand repeat-containing protein n=1 Tax=Methylobacter sp. G7 TaxID=3230117 RepID=UPI003D808235